MLSLTQCRDIFFPKPFPLTEGIEPTEEIYPILLQFVKIAVAIGLLALYNK